MRSASTLIDAIKSPSDSAILMHGLSAKEQALVHESIALSAPIYGDRLLPIGEQITNHVFGVARQASLLEMDVTARCAAILSRIPSIHPQSSEKIREIFGESCWQLIFGLDKLRRLDQMLFRHLKVADDKNIKNAEAQAEALRKMLLVLSDDMRMVVLKLISRIQTLHYIYKNPTESARETASATLHFFAPLANRLGMHELKWPLEDWSFRILEPQIYQQLANSLAIRRTAREKIVHDFLAELSAMVEKLGIQAHIKGRAKHLFSIHRKMVRKKSGIAELYDLYATRVLVDSVEDCYRVLAQLHGRWSYLQKEFDDYIAKPKDNGYQSLHSVVLFGEYPIEVQIRTHAMHRLAEMGMASHWRYKEGVADDSQFEERLTLLRELMSWQKEVAQEDQRLKLLTEETLYCLTPKGEVFDLPQGATPVDFAYRVHSELGHRCRGARVDGQLVPLSTILKSGQCIDIITAKEGGPSRDWLLDDSPFLKSARARAKVRQWFNVREHQERIAEGRSSWLRIQNRLRPAGKPAPSGEEVSQALGFGEINEFYLAISRGEVGMHQLQALIRGVDSAEVSLKTQAMRKKATPSAKNPANDLESLYNGKINVLDLGEMSTQKAACCQPQPPVPIIGYITRQNIVSVHRADCRELWQISNRLPERVIAVAWQKNSGTKKRPYVKQRYPTLMIEGKEPTQTPASAALLSAPLLTQVLSWLQQQAVPIHAMHFEQNNQVPQLSIQIDINPEEVANLVLELSQLPNIRQVRWRDEAV